MKIRIKPKTLTDKQKLRILKDKNPHFSKLIKELDLQLIEDKHKTR